MFILLSIFLWYTHLYICVLLLLLLLLLLYSSYFVKYDNTTHDDVVAVTYRTMYLKY